MRQILICVFLVLSIAPYIFFFAPNKIEPELAEVDLDIIAGVSEVEKTDVELTEDTAPDGARIIDEFFWELKRPLAILPSRDNAEVSVLGGVILPSEKKPESDGAQERLSRINYNYGLTDVTGDGHIRALRAKLGVDFNVVDGSSVGVEVGRKIHDKQDAKAWGDSVDDKNEAQVNYKLVF